METYKTPDYYCGSQINKLEQLQRQSAKNLVTALVHIASQFQLEQIFGQ